MNHYVVISEDGTNTFYDTATYRTIPNDALIVSFSDYLKYFSSVGKYSFYKKATAGKTIVTLTSADIESITIQGITFASSTDYKIGDTIAETSINIVNAINNNTNITDIYTVTSDNTGFTVEETIAGKGNTPGIIRSSSVIALTMVQSTGASLCEITNKFCYYNYGMEYKIVKSNYTTSKGELLFDTKQTPEELEFAFPSIASSKEFTLVTNGVTGDTFKFYDTTITLGTEVAVGATIEDTIANLVAYMKSNVLFTGNYKITSTDNSFVLTERFCGGGIVIPDIITAGTIKLSSKTLSGSVWGYETQTKYERKLALQAKADAQKEIYRNAYFSALADGDSATAELNLGYARELKTSLYNAMEAINDE